MYDSTGGGLYVEAALFSIGVSSEQLVCNVAKQRSTLSNMYHGH